MPKRLTITKRIRKVKSQESKTLLGIGWAVSWDREQTQLIKRLGVAVRDDDFNELCICVGQLKEMSEKKFSALKNVINIVSGTEGEIDLAASEKFYLERK